MSKIGVHDRREHWYWADIVVRDSMAEFSYLGIILDSSQFIFFTT